MTKIEFEVKDEVARRWYHILRHTFEGNLTPERLAAVKLNDLVKLAAFSFVAEELQKDAQAAWKVLDAEMTGEKGDDDGK